jgi:adenylylsulfate kinase
MAERHIVRQHGDVSREERGRLLKQSGAVIWLTGLSGSGKSTVAYALERRLMDLGKLTYVLDGDNVRHGLCKDLGFSPKDRVENIRRIGEVAALFAEAGLLVITSFISPYRSDRTSARAMAGSNRFVEVFLDANLETCEKRDPKGLYKKARAGEISEFTGISAPYESPDDPELTLSTGTLSVDACVALVVAYLNDKGFLRAPG